MAGDGTGVAEAGQLAQARRLAQDVSRSCGRKLWLVAVLAVAAALAEGMGLLMLAPLLQALGVAGGGAGDGPLAALGAMLGLGGALALFVLLLSLAGGIVMAYAVASQSLVLDFGDDLRRRLHAAILSVGWGSPALRRPADLTHALTTEVAQCGHAVDQFLRALGAGVQVPVLLLAALALSPAFTLVALCMGLVLALAVVPLNRRAHALAARIVLSHGDYHAEAADQVAGLRTLKVLSAERLRVPVLEARAGALRDARMGQARSFAVVRQLQGVMAAAVLAVGLWVGVAVVGVALADLLALVLVFARLMMVSIRLQDQWRQILRVLPTHARVVGRIAACRAESEPPPAEPGPRLARELRLDRVGYRHPGGDAPTLSGVDLVLPAFTTTALVGPSGAGKSTLADLAMGLIAPTEGEIRVDGRPLDAPGRVAWRRRGGYVPQDPFLFHASIRENLLMAAPEAGEDELWEALRRAAAGFVESLPQGLDTPVGERGSRLSGGERQRVALAQALLRRPDLLILDEPTSALDAGTEAAVMEGLASLRGSTTILVVTHRPAILALADQVARLEAGRLVGVQPAMPTREPIQTEA